MWKVPVTPGARWVPPGSGATSSITLRWRSHPSTKFAYKLSRGIGIRDTMDGAVIKNTLGSYTHLHPVGSRDMFRNFVDNCRGRK